MAVSDDWYSRIESKLYTQVKTRLASTFGERYPNLFFTTAESINSFPKFPTFHFICAGMSETGRDLDNTGVNAVRMVIQVSVYGQRKADCVAIMNETIRLMKGLFRFNMTAMPIYGDYDADVKVGVVRFHRVIGANDSDIVAQ